MHTDYNRYFFHLLLQNCSLTLKSASGGNMMVLENIEVTPHYGNQVHRLCLRVVHGQSRLLGRN